MKKAWLGHLAGIISSFLMGFSWYATKCIGVVSGAAVLDVLSARYIISGLVLFLAWRLGAIRLDYQGKPLRPLIQLSLLMPVLYNILEYSALNYINSAEIGMLCSLATVVSPLLGYFLLREPVPKREGLFMLVAVSGVLFINVFEFDPHSSTNIGRLMMLGCVLCASFNRILSRQASKRFTSMEITAVMMWSSAAVLTALSLGRHLIQGDLVQYGKFLSNSKIYPYLLYLSLGCSLLGFLLNNLAISNLPLTRSSILVTISTVVAVVSGAVLLDEPLVWYDYLGCAFIVAGVIGCNLSRKTPTVCKISNGADSGMT